MSAAEGIKPRGASVDEVRLNKNSSSWTRGQKIGVAITVIGTLATVFGILSMYLNILPEDYTKYAGLVFLGGCTLMAGSIIYLTKDWKHAGKFALAVGILGTLGGIYGTLSYFNTTIQGFNLDQVGHTGSALIAIGGAFMLGGAAILSAVRKKDEEELTVAVDPPKPEDKEPSGKEPPKGTGPRPAGPGAGDAPPAGAT